MKHVPISNCFGVTLQKGGNSRDGGAGGCCSRGDTRCHTAKSLGSEGIGKALLKVVERSVERLGNGSDLAKHRQGSKRSRASTVVASNNFSSQL